MDVLPSTAYSSRQARRGSLNTIKEESEGSGRSDSEGSASDRTIIGKPAGWNPKMFVAVPRKPSRLATYVTPSSPVSSVGDSPCSSAGEGIRQSKRSSYTTSENGTLFSDESCPSLASDPTSFATESNRDSIASSNKSGRNRYPALLIPRGSWQSVDCSIEEVAFGMSPKATMVLSPEALSQLSQQLPPENALPSLATSSLASSSPCLAQISAPGTPDSRQLDVVEGENWGQVNQATRHLEIAIDEDHSILISPAEDNGPMPATPLSAGPYQTLPSARDREWGEMVIKFLVVPGSTPPANQTQLAPHQNPRVRLLRAASMAGTESGVMLPSDALQTLQRITRAVSPDRSTNCSEENQEEEMRERSDGGTLSRSQSLDNMTPVTDTSLAKLSDYSFTQLSIPSPGGFFSSLHAGTRHTWCLNKSASNSMPTSAVAEKFYFDWAPRTAIRETTLAIGASSDTEGPPTARRILPAIESPTVNKQSFELAPSTSRPRAGSVSSASEDDDLYGPGLNEPTFAAPADIEYEEAYEEELKQTAEQNLGRTSNWLAAQTSYLSALREIESADKSEDPTSTRPLADDEPSALQRSASMVAHIQKTVRFLEAAKATASPTTILQTSNTTSPDSAATTKTPLFNAAFEHFLQQNATRDTFIHAATRVEAVRAGRIATPAQHLASISGHLTSPTPPSDRPKYSGPFSGNPRATGVFERHPTTLAFEQADAQQRAMHTIRHSVWQIEALRATFNGRLLASRVIGERLHRKATILLTDPACTGPKRHRMLDLGGDANASWGWAAAHEFPNVKIYTVVTKEQAFHQRPADEPIPTGPDNHRTVSVPHLWQLPFKPNHFDVVSARSLHALLKANPVPGVSEIDEWTLTLKECMRVLKPGGYVDFIVMDSSVARAGPRGETLSVEFGFDLHRRGYERDPARSWLRRLKKEGFVGVKRAWMFWPMGRRPGGGGEDGGCLGEVGSARTFQPAPRPVSEVSTISKIVSKYLDVEAVQGPVGSTQDAADVTGLLGTRMFEEWLVKVRREVGWEEGRLLEGVDECLEEGKASGGGFRVLVGWARKPRVVKEKGKRKAVVKDEAMQVPGGQSPLKEEIQIALDESDGELKRPFSGLGLPMMVVR